MHTRDAQGALILPIRGMTCRSCELLLEEALGAVPGVASVHVKRNQQCARISLVGDVDESTLEAAVRGAGYDVGHENVPWLTADRAMWLRVVFAAVGVAAIYLILVGSGVQIPSLDLSGKALTISVAVLVGLTAGFSTCMALLGGIILAVAARHTQERQDLTTWQRFQPHLAFNAGRLVGFALLGGVLGIVGSALQMGDRSIALLTLIVGVVMVILGLKIAGISPRLARMSIALPSWATWRGKHDTKRHPLFAAAATGALSFFLPCGFTLAMQVAAIGTGSFWGGALVMAGFALGTAPGLLAVAGIASSLHGKMARALFAVAGVLVLALGIVNIRSSLGTLSVAAGPIAQAPTPSQIPSDQMVEEIRMTQDGDGYSPNRFTIKSGSRVRWVITSTNAFTCASSLRVPALGISKQLQQGENVIEFTAPAPGEVAFHCSMNMYRGSFTVL